MLIFSGESSDRSFQAACNLNVSHGFAKLRSDCKKKENTTWKTDR